MSSDRGTSTQPSWGLDDWVALSERLEEGAAILERDEKAPQLRKNLRIARTMINKLTRKMGADSNHGSQGPATQTSSAPISTSTTTTASTEGSAYVPDELAAAREEAEDNSEVHMVLYSRPFFLFGIIG